VKYRFPIVILAAILVMGACTSSDSSPPVEDKKDATARCTEPQNPYDDGTGHYAGYEWAEENPTDCNGSSESFIEGCQEYERQESEFQDCEARNKR
jgi:hypothetical protein